jgi:hypothetical protein
MAKRKNADDEQEPTPESNDETQAVEAAVETDTPEHDHYIRIRELNREVLSARWEWESAKESAAAKKKTFDSIMLDLTSLIARGPEVLPLFDGNAGEEWKGRPITVLNLADGINDTLGDAGISTIGELKDFWAADKSLEDCRGIGPEKAATISDAFHKYAEKHPEVFGQPAPESEGSTQDGPPEETAA